MPRKGKRQRFYARNALKTTLDRGFGGPAPAFRGRTIPYYPTRIHPALTSLADEVCGTLARLIAYVGALALLGIVGVHLWDQLPLAEAADPTEKPAWSMATRSPPAFAVSQFGLPDKDKTETYEVLRHPEGGRKDVIRWMSGDRAVAELEVYRLGGELVPSGPLFAERTARLRPLGLREAEAAGIIDSKFGAATLLGLSDTATGGRSCLGFFKRLDQANLQISGWSCLGESLPAQRATIGCMLNRLVLLTVGNDPKLADLFARAELKRGVCAGPSAPAGSADWVTGAENPLLRGTI